MSEHAYPKFATGKGIEIKMTPQMGVIECGYGHLIRTFGQPTYSRDAGDEFDGVERVAWHIMFQSGERVRISDVRVFGSLEDDHNKIKNWRVNTHSQNAYNWIKQAIRESNPNAR
jgi:hypothetical protein